MLLGRSPHPNRQAGRQQQLVSGGLRNDAAAGCHDEGRVFGKRGLESGTLAASEGLLTEHFKNLGETHSILLLDHAIEFEKRHVQPAREQLPNRGFSSASQAYESNSFFASSACLTFKMAKQQVARFGKL